MHHVFQPFPVEELEFNPFQKFSEDWAALVVKDKPNKKVNAMTIGWGMVGYLWGKNVCAVFVHSSRYTKELMDNEETCSINFLDMSVKGNRNALKYLGAATGKTEDKIKSIGFHVDASGDTPYLDESNFVIVCKKIASYPIESAGFVSQEAWKKIYSNDELHHMYILEITDVMAR